MALDRNIAYIQTGGKMFMVHMYKGGSQRRSRRGKVVGIPRHDGKNV